MGRSLSLAALVSFVLVVALGLRLYGIDWDQGSLFHPDERAIYMKVWDLAFPATDPGLLLDPEESPWNPRWFPYGSLPLYLLKGAQYAASPFVDFQFGDLRIVGRILTAVADTTTVLLVFLFGRRVFGVRTGMLSAILAAFTVLTIQSSHFYIVEPFFALFVAVALWFLMDVAEHARIRHSVLAGLFIGLALATKVSAAPVMAAAGVAYVAYAFSREHRWLVFAWPDRSRLTRTAAGGAAALAAAGAAFFVAAPYAILDWDRFLGDVLYQAGMVTRDIDLPYTRQYVDTPEVLYHVRQLSVWGLGLPLAVFAWGGLLAALAWAWRGRDKRIILLLAWVVPYFAITGSFEVKFLRYLIPITPFLVLFGGALMVRAIDGVGGRWPRAAPAAQGVALAVVIATAFYALAYLGIYTQPHTANRASEWIQANAAPGSLLLTEHWEEGIPGLQQYRVKQLPMYEADNDRKLDVVTGTLAEGDYLVFYSHRLYGTIARLPERYPMSRRYYRALFAGELGYELVRWEWSYPLLLGVAFKDDTFSRPGLPTPEPLQGSRPAPVTLDLGFADESFTVYDHPKVLIFRNTERLGQAALEARLMGEDGGTTLETGGGLAVREGQEGALMLSAEERAVQREGGTWTDIFHRDAWAADLAPWSWLALIALISLATLPVALVVFQWLPDKGYLLAKPLGLLLVGYPVWLLSSLKMVPFTAGAVYGGIAILALISAGVLYARWREMREWAGDHWRIWLVGEAVFLAAFLIFLLVRMANPDLWHPWRGGEKPMELAYLNAIIRSTSMPPYDPWFAGGYLNYYYYGFFLFATVIKALGIPTSIAFNLAVPTVFALAFGGAFAVVYNLVELARPGRIRTGWPWSSAGAGLLGGILVTVLGNLDGVAQVAQNAWRVLAQGGGAVPFDYWRSSRLMPPDPPGHEITEFPYWSFLFGDLHPHMMVIPFSLLALGLGLSALVGLRHRAWVGAMVAPFLALTVGALWAINTWNYPTYAALGAVVLGLGAFTSGPPSLRRAALGAVLAGGFLLATYLLFLPFHERYTVFGAGAVLSETQTRLWQYLAVNGLFFTVVVTYLVREAAPLLRAQLRSTLAHRVRAAVPERVFLNPPVLNGTPSTEAYVRESLPPVLWDASPGDGLSEAPSRLPSALRPWPVLAGMAGVIGMAAAALGLVSAGYTLVGVLGVALSLCAYLLVRESCAGAGSRPAILFVLLLVGLGLGLGAGVDLVTLKNDIGRMNTVFKFYEQAWVILGVASAFLLWRLRFGLSLPSRWRRIPQGTWMGLALLLLAGGLVFPVLGTRARLQDRFDTGLPLTMDGTAYMREAVYHDPEGGALTLGHDLKAIRWLQEHVEGSPVVLEGITPLYRWGNRIAGYTGLPAIIGWDWHQTQQRGDYSHEVQARREAVDTLYRTADPERALRLLKRYNVEYIVVGELERLYYPRAGLAKFDAMAGETLEQVFSTPEEAPKVTIYRVGL